MLTLILTSSQSTPPCVRVEGIPWTSRRRTLLSLLAVLVYAPLRAQTVESTTERRELALSVRAKVERLAALDLELATTRRARNARLRKLRTATERLRSQLVPVRARRRELEERKASLDSARTELRESMKRREALVAHLERSTAPLADQLLESARQGIPFRREARSAVAKDLRESLRSEDGLERIRGLRELWTHAGDELELSGKRAFWNGPLLLDDGRTRVHAFQLRLGLAYQLFLSEDGERAGWWARGRWQPLERDDPSRSALDSAVKTLRGRAPPGWISLPVLLER